MTLTPAQQFAADYDAKMAELAKLQAKVQSLAEQVSQDGQRIDQNAADISDAEVRLDNLEVGEVLPPSPLPEPPVFEPEPTPPPTDGDLYAGVPDYLRDLDINTNSPDGKLRRVRYDGWNVVSGNGTLASNKDEALIDQGVYNAADNHTGWCLNDVKTAYIVGATFNGFQHVTQPNGANTHVIVRNVDMHGIREDALRNITGLVENVTLHSANMIGGGHGDTLDLKNYTDGLTIRNLRSLTGKLNGIITAYVKNIVIDGYEHLGDHDHLSIDIGGDAENVTIRNCKLSGDIRFRGSKTNVNIEWDTVRTNVPRDEF